MYKTVVLTDDKNVAYLFRDNLAKVCIDGCFNVQL